MARVKQRGKEINRELCGPAGHMEKDFGFSSE